jgi:hypothetical protein
LKSYLSIEHIMPQKLDDWWKNHLGVDSEINHELLIHSLGNLTLTAIEYNQQLSNHNFPTKQALLKNSHLELNRYFHQQNSWTKEDIEKRTEILADQCLEIWNYFGNESVKISKSNQITGTKPKKLSFFGAEYSVITWRDVCEKTMNLIIDFDPDQFDIILKNFPRFVADDPKKFQETRQLQNGKFIEVSLSAKDIYNFCLKAIEITEIPAGEWQIEYE